PQLARQQEGHQTTKRESPLDIADQLQKLHQLHGCGALSDEEFAKAKQACLVLMIPNAPAGQEEILEILAEEEIVETQAVTREGKRRKRAPQMPPQTPNAQQVQYRAAHFKDLYTRFMLKYVAVLSVCLITGFLPHKTPQEALIHLLPQLAGMILVIVLSGM